MAKCLRSFPCISKTHAVKWADHSTAFRCISGMHASAGSRYETNCQSARWPGTPPEQTAGITGPDLEVTTPLPLKNPEMQLPLGALPRDWANSERHVPPRSLEAKTQQESYRIQRYTATSKLPPDAETSSNLAPPATSLPCAPPCMRPSSPAARHLVSDFLDISPHNFSFLMWALLSGQGMHAPCGVISLGMCNE